MHFKKILVTGCGGDIGLGIGRILKGEDVADEIIGCDIHDHHAGKVFLDACFDIVPASSPDYREHLLELADGQDVDLIIPTSEAELRLLLEEDFFGMPNRFLTVNPEAMNTGFDKYQTSRFLERIGCPFPWTESAVDNNPVTFPCILKGRWSCGSRSVRILEDIEALNTIQIKEEDIFQEYLDGPEYTCCIFRAQGIVRTIILRRELRFGMTIWGQVEEDDAIDALLRRLAEALDVRGSINVQLRMREGKPVVFEINPRFSSTVVFRHKLGFRDMIWSMENHAGEQISSYVPPVSGTEFWKIFEDVVDTSIQTMTPTVR